MNAKTKKIIIIAAAVLLVAALVTVILVCSNRGTGDKELDAAIKSGKLILNVATYDGGIGTDWIKASKAEFEAMYADRQFGGKKGVYINLIGNKQLGGDTIENDSLKYDVYFTEMVNYYSFVNKGKFADISDIVKGSYPAEFGASAEEGSIESKLQDSWKEYLTSKDGKYYALPFYDGLYGIFYDVDLFEENNWYFNRAGVFRGMGEKSLGLDGIEGTDDDGLPTTYEQFAEMLYGIVSAGYTPFSYAGGVEYVQRMLANLWSNYEGLEQMQLNNTFDGMADHIVTSFDADGNPIIGTAEINAGNGYLLQKQAGKYYALDFLKNVVLGSTGNYSGPAVNGYGFRQAQTNFVTGRYKNKAEKFAMLIDGAWWEHEATTDFDLVAQRNPGQTKATRKFGFMPVPKVNDSQTYEKQTLVSQNNSYCFVNANSANMEAAKLFLQFVHTDRQLAQFTVGTSVTRSLNYEMSDEQLAACSYYGRNIYRTKKSADIYYPVSSVDYVVNNIGYYDFETSWCWLSKNGTVQSTEVLSRIAGGETPRKYFEGLSEYFNAGSWKGKKEE